MANFSELFLTVPEATDALRARHMLLLRDAEGSGALILSAQFAHPEIIFRLQRMAHSALNVLLPGARLDFLRVPAQSEPVVLPDTVEPSSPTVTVAAVRALVDVSTRPGTFQIDPFLHIVRSQPGRADLAEAALDLARIAGLEDAMLLCPVLDSEGELLRGGELYQLARAERISMIAQEAIFRYQQEHRVSLVTETLLPTDRAEFRLFNYQEIETRQPYVALLLGNVHKDDQEPPLLRLHSACATGDIFGSQRCDCQAQLHAALDMIAQEGRGLLLYLPQEGRGIGLTGKLQTYALQDQGLDTLDANRAMGYPDDARDYESALEILHDLDITRVRLMTNNPDKVSALQKSGIAVERVALEIHPTSSNSYYLQTKYERMGHLLTTFPHPLISG